MSILAVTAPRGLRGGHFDRAGASSSSGASSRNLSVPYVGQTNSYGCWNATMNMVRAYFGQPPIGKAQVGYLYDKEGQPKPLDAQMDYKTRNRKARLKNVEAPASKSWSAAEIARLVDEHGPVEVLINVEEGWQHNIVVTGLDEGGENVVYHDPAVGPSRKMSIAQFDARFCWDYHRSALTAFDAR